MGSWATTFNDGCVHMTTPGGRGCFCLFLPFFSLFSPFSALWSAATSAAHCARIRVFPRGRGVRQSGFGFWLVYWPLSKVTRQHLAGLLSGALGSGPRSRVSSSASLCLSLLRPTKQTSAIARALPVECPPPLQRPRLTSLFPSSCAWARRNLPRRTVVVSSHQRHAQRGYGRVVRSRSALP